jgi:predicted transcriptional regulator
MNEQLRLWNKPFSELWDKANRIKIHDFIKMPTYQMVNANEKIEAAFHLFVVGRHGSLFVQDGNKIVGLILFSDVYKKIRETIRCCPLPPAA